MKTAFRASETFSFDREMNFFFVPASIKRMSIEGVRPSLPLFNLRVLRFLFLPYRIESPRFSGILKPISGYLFRFPIFFHGSLSDWTKRLVVRIIYRSNVHTAHSSCKVNDCLRKKRRVCSRVSILERRRVTWTVRKNSIVEHGEVTAIWIMYNAIVCAAM